MLLYDAILRNHAKYSQLKKKGRKGKWSAHVVRNGCAKKEGNEPFMIKFTRRHIINEI